MTRFKYATVDSDDICKYCSLQVDFEPLDTNFCEQILSTRRENEFLVYEKL